MRGRLIAIEGLDGTGKTTLSHSLAHHLDALWTTTPGPRVRAEREWFDAVLAANPVSRPLAYAASVAAEAPVLEAARDAGRDVVVDRYLLSTLAWADPDVARSLQGLADVVPAADVTLYLNAPTAVRAGRLARRGMSPHDAATLEADHATTVDRRYRALAATRVAGRFVPLDATADAAAVLRAALHAL